nr:hypothetical protein [Tanacetum cinerariifolium]
MMVMIVNNNSSLSMNMNRCQPINQNDDFSGSDQIQTPQYPEVHPPSPEQSDEVCQAKEDLFKSIQTFLETFNCIPFEEKPKILFQAWEFFFAIQYSKPENPNDLFQKLLGDLKELAEYEKSPSRDHSNFLNDNENHSDQNKECFKNSSDEIATSNPNKEKEEPPQDSNIHQLIEECSTEVSEEQKQSMEDTMLELDKICQENEFLFIHDNVDDLIESALKTKLLSINSQCLDNKEQEVKKVVEQPAERGNRSIESLQNFRVIYKSSISLKITSQISSIHAFAPILSTKELEYSLSMGYEHSNTTPKTESDEIIKSGVEELVPILSEDEVTLEDKRECNVPVCENSHICYDHSEIFSDSKNDDDISVYDDDFEDIEYVEASLPDPEIVSVEEENVVYQEEKEVDLDISQIQDVDLHEKLLSITRLISNIESLNDNPIPDLVLNSFVSIPTFEESDNYLSDNFSPEFETFCDYTEETRSAWERFYEIKHAFTDKQCQPEEIQELMCKLLEDVRNLREELAEYINSPSWNRLTFYNDDEEHSIQYKEYLENSSNAIAPVLQTEEPQYYLSMGYEHLSTIPKTESDEVIKSNVKNLVQIPREYEVTSNNESKCDVPVCEDSFDVLKDHPEILSNSNKDDILSDDDAFEDVEYVEASELISLEEENDVHQEEKEFDLEDILQIQDVILHEKLLCINRLIADIEFLNDNPTPDHVLKSSFSIPNFEKSDNYLDNSLPEFKTFSDHTEEMSSGSTTGHANNSLPEYDSFCFEIDPDQGWLTSVVMKDISDNSTNDPLLEEVDLFLASDNSIPPGIENNDYDSEGDIYFLKELLIDDSIPLLENESSNFDHHDDPSFPRPPPEPPDVELFFDFEPNSGEDNPSVPRPSPEPPDVEFDAGKEIPVVMNDKDE